MMQRHAKNLQNIEKADLPRDMVGLMVSERGYSANITSLKTAMRMQDAVLDLLA
jgi:flagellar basal body rod protein FlgC